MVSTMITIVAEQAHINPEQTEHCLKVSSIVNIRNSYKHYILHTPCKELSAYENRKVYNYKYFS